MVQIEKEGYIFSVDIEKTKEYYNTHSLCDCACCRNFYAQVAKALPRLKKFLEDFGVDITKPDEISSIESDNCIDYLSVDYTVCGEILDSTEYEIDIHDNMFLSIVISDCFVSPNEQQGTYFTISVMQIKLPWVLEEPFPAPIKVVKQNIFSNLFVCNNMKKFLKNPFKSKRKNNWYDKYQKLDLKSGRIQFILEDDEDMIEIRYDDGMLIDIGYIEKYKKYYITVVESDNVKDWETPLEVIEVISKENLFNEIQEIILKFRK